MPAYVVVTISVEDPAAYERYKEQAPASIAAYGGRYLVRGGALETIEGTWSPARLVILEFPNMDRARAWVSSPEYRPAKALRQACATSQMVLIDGVRGEGTAKP